VKADLSIGGAPDRAGNTKFFLDNLRGPLNASADDKATLAGELDSGPRHIQQGPYIIVTSPKGDRVAVYDKRTGGSKLLELPVPDGSRHVVTPILGNRILALIIQGPKISRIAVYTVYGNVDPSVEAWYPQELREPVDQVSVTFRSMTAAYALGRYVYAFSARSDRWDVLELPPGSQPSLGQDPKSFTVSNGGHLYEFNESSGKWVDIDFNAILEKTMPAKNVRTPGLQ